MQEYYQRAKRTCEARKLKFAAVGRTMSGLRTFWSELNPKISSIYHNYFDNWWGKVTISSTILVLIIIVLSIVPSWIQFGFLLISTIGMWSFFTSKKLTYQPTKRQFTVTTNYNNDVNPNSSNSNSVSSPIHLNRSNLHRNSSVVSPLSSKFVSNGLRSNEEDLDQSSSSSTADWHQNSSRREPIDPITLSAVTSPGFSARLLQKKDSNPLRESNSDLSISPVQRGSYHNQKSPSSFKLGQLPSPSWKPQSKLNPPSFQSPVNTGRFSVTRRSKKQVPFGTTYVHVAPVDVINKSIAASKAASNSNSPGNARVAISFGMGGYPSSPTANITTRMQKLWSPPTMDAVGPYETTSRPNVGGSSPPHNKTSCSADAGLNRKRNRLADMVDKRSSTIHHGPSNYGQEELAKQNSKRTKYIQSPNDLRYAAVNAANRNLPFMALPNLQTHDDESMTSESILEQMNQTEKRFLPDDDGISPIRSSKKTRSSAGTTKGSSMGQNSSSPYRKRRVVDQSISNLQEEDEGEKSRGFCSCSECYEEAAGMDLKGKKIAKQSSPTSDFVPSSKKKKTVTFNHCKSTSPNQSKGYICAKTNDKIQTDITDKYTPVKMQIISKANYEADQQRRLERLNRMLNESFKRSEYKPKSAEPRTQQLSSNGPGSASVPSFGSAKESSGLPIKFGSGNTNSVFSSSVATPDRVGEDQVEGTKQGACVLSSSLSTEGSKITPTTDENGVTKIMSEKSTGSLFALGAKTEESTTITPPAPLFGQAGSSSLNLGQDLASPSVVAGTLGLGSKSDSSSSSNNPQKIDALSFGLNTVPLVTTSDSSGSSIPAGFSFGAQVSSRSPSLSAASIFTSSKSDQILPTTVLSSSSTTPATTVPANSLFGTINPSTAASNATSSSNFSFNVIPTSVNGKSAASSVTTDILTSTSSSGAPVSTSSVSGSGGFTFGVPATAVSVAPATTVTATPTSSFAFSGSTPAETTTKSETQPSQSASLFSFGNPGSGVATDPNKSIETTSATEVKPGGFSFGQAATTQSANATNNSSALTFGQPSGGFKFGATTTTPTVINPESVSGASQGNVGTAGTFQLTNASTTAESTQNLFSNSKEISNSSTGLFGQPTTTASTNLFNTATSTVTLANTTAASSVANTASTTAPTFSFGQVSNTPVSNVQSLNTSSSFGQSSGSGGFGFNPVFGQKSGDGTTSTPTSFGQNTGTAAVPTFGQGVNSPSTAFGQSTTAPGTSIFGQGNTSTTTPNLSFGQGSTTANISFGQGSAISTSSGFGQDKSAPNFSFGQSSTSTFGQASPGVTVPSFGQGNAGSTTPSFGQSNAGTSVPAFGQGNPGSATPTFGPSNTGTSTPTFGQANTSGTGFGQGNTNSSSGIFGQGSSGATTNLFGQGSSTGNAGSFGQSNTTPNTGFGKGTSAGGGTMFGQGNTSTSGNVFGQSPTGTVPTFGQTTQGATSPFGQSTAAPANNFGQSGGSSGVFTFGQTGNNSSFGQTNNSGASFGSPANKPVFGQPASNTNSGGGSFPSFGQTPATPSGGFNFGAANNTSALTASPQSSPFGGGSGGGFNVSQPQAGAGMFGSATNANPPTSGVFQFGQQQQQQQPAQGGFNFGQQQQPFGAAAQPQQPMFNMGTSTSSARRRDTRGRRYR